MNNKVVCENCAFAKKPNNHTPWYDCHRYPPIRVDDPNQLYSSRWQHPVVEATSFCGEWISVSVWNSKHSTYQNSTEDEVYI